MFLKYSQNKAHPTTGFNWEWNKVTKQSVFISQVVKAEEKKIQLEKKHSI